MSFLNEASAFWGILRTAEHEMAGPFAADSVSLALRLRVAIHRGSAVPVEKRLTVSFIGGEFRAPPRIGEGPSLKRQRH
jgi:hypothetical protein